MANRRLFLFKGAMWTIAGAAAAIAVLRFALGLGTMTLLSDRAPWGLWIGFDVMGGVALAAGGFVMAALVHIFRMERYHAAARPAILTAFLGYGAVAVGLLFDLGLPWNIWRPMIFWNPRSPLFEVAWCVMLYLSVLALEVAPVILAKTPFQKLRGLLMRLALPIMILGIMLSTLHQSSLGTMLLIMPFRLHPLWYTTLLPEVFFISAICLGLTMVIFESSLTSWLYRHEPEKDMLEGLSKLAAWALALYAAFRFGDLAWQGKLGLLAEGTWIRNLFLLEVALSALIPMVLFFIPAVRRSPKTIWFASALSVLGFVLNRINASGLSQVWATDFFYFPAWTEFSISLGVVAACALVFLFVQEHFPVDPERLKAQEEARLLAERSKPVFAPFTQVWLGEGWRKAAKVFSFLFLVGFALAFTLAPKGHLSRERPVQRARGGSVLRVGSAERAVYFDHERHKKDSGGETSCPVCHHLHKPGDSGTPCSECHRDMFLPTDTFDHSAHLRARPGPEGCTACHGAQRPVKVAAAVRCDSCHAEDMVAQNPVVKGFTSRRAAPYKDAMHKMCIPCHVMNAADPHPELGRCGTCHNEGTASEKLYRASAAGRGGPGAAP
jgi:Ni/Fe-hydrogenase subunit HybB-like protein